MKGSASLQSDHLVGMYDGTMCGKQVTKGQFVLYVLCMDEFTRAALSWCNCPKMRLIPLSDIEDDALLAVKLHRTVGEYCWTCTTPLLTYVLDLFPPGAVVSYVDADICFYSNPEAILHELGDGSIFIHEHDFSPEYAHLQASSGRFKRSLNSSNPPAASTSSPLAS